MNTAKIEGVELKQGSELAAVKNKLGEINALLTNSDLRGSAPSVFNAAASSLLFRLYYNQLLDLDNEKLYQDLVEFIRGVCQETELGFTYCNGWVGFGFFLQLLIDEDFLELETDLLEEIDLIAYKFALQCFKKDNHDVLHGGLGAVHHLLYRNCSSLKVKSYLKELLYELAGNGRTSAEGLYWPEPELFVEEELAGKKVVNLNLSHGQASKLFVLSNYVQNGVAKGKARKMLKAAVDFILFYEKDNCLPTRLIDNVPEYQHAGWCRGNLAMALALCKAAKALEDDTLQLKAIAIGLETINGNGESPLYEAGICHGFSGLALMYHRFYQMTGVYSFKMAADDWLNKTMEAAHHSDGLAGFKHWDGIQKEWRNNVALMSGISGIGLAFLSVKFKSTLWDRIFLLG